MSVFLIVPFFLCMFINLLIMKELKVRLRMKFKIRPVFLNDSTNRLSNIPKEKKAFQTLLLLQTVLFICWVPYMIVLLLVKFESQRMNQLFFKIIQLFKGMEFDWRHISRYGLFYCIFLFAAYSNYIDLNRRKLFIQKLLVKFIFR